MSATAAPMCSICETAHWLGREPHVFGKAPAKADKAAVTPAKPHRGKAKKKGKK